jgi:hypothetical protein
MIDATILQVGRQPQLFIDNWLIEQSDSVTRRWHQPKRVGDGPVLKADRPWEHTPYFTYSNFNVLKDPADGLIKCWYEDLGPMQPYQRHPWQNRMLYAVSEDGLNFEKPLMDRVLVDGERTNIFAGYAEGAPPNAINPWADMGVHSAAIVIDPEPADPAQRYRMLFTRATPDYRHSTDLAHSADGLTWASYGVTPTFGNSGGRLSDVSTITYDPVTKLYLQYTRHGRMSTVGAPGDWPGVPSGWGGCFASYYPNRPDLMNKRRVYRTVSTDFRNWTDLVAAVTPDDMTDNLDEAYYGLGQFRVGGLHFGTLGVLKYVDNEMEVRLVYSRDGISWQPTNRSNAFLAPRGGEHWDRHMVSIVSPPVQVGDQWYFYHGGSWAHHDYWWAGPQQLDHPEARDPSGEVRFGMGVAAMRFEGLVSLENHGPRIGRIVTRPLSTDGRSLWINSVGKGGRIRVAVSDANGRILPGRGFEDCTPLTADAIRNEVVWASGNAPDPEGSSDRFIKLWFEIDDAELYSFGFGD